jgi:uncharacterized membrane protein YfcA
VLWLGGYLFVLLVGLVAGAISGVIGTGSSIMLLPVLVLTFGPKQAVPIMAVAAVMANIGLGIFFLAMIPLRHWLDAKKIHIRLWQLSVAGGLIGYLTGIVLSTGPLSVPAFSSYGLIKGAFLSTEAISSLALYISKVVTFQELGALPREVILQGVIVGLSLMLGTFVAKRVVQRMSIASFRYVLDVLLLCSGLSMLWTAFVSSSR